jgi:hypothetical protein
LHKPRPTLTQTLSQTPIITLGTLGVILEITLNLLFAQETVVEMVPVIMDSAIAKLDSWELLVRK